MNFLEERITKDGIVKEGNVLKVDSFLNHQMDIQLFDEIGEEFKRRFANEHINKILTFRSFSQRSQKALTLKVKCTLRKWNPSPTNARIR